MRASSLAVAASLEATFSSARGVARVSASPPLELRGPFREVGELPLYILKNVTAGVFSGDHYDVTLRAESGARVRVNTASAAKVCEMPGGQADCRLTIEAEAGSIMRYGPAPMILQAGSDFSQTTQIQVATGATLVYSEVVAFGRLARGECLAFRRFSNELSVVIAGDAAPTYAERFTLCNPGAGGTVGQALSGYGVLGTLIYLGPDSEALAGYLHVRLTEGPGAFGGATTLPAHQGVIVKVLASSLQTALEVLKASEATILSWREPSQS